MSAMQSRFYRHGNSAASVRLTAYLVHALRDGATLVVDTPYVFPEDQNWLVWETVLAGAGLADRPPFGETWTFGSESMKWAEAIFLLAILFSADVRLSAVGFDLTIETSHHEDIEVRSRDPIVFERITRRLDALLDYFLPRSGT